jgi:hypothetical protein
MPLHAIAHDGAMLTQSHMMIVMFALSFYLISTMY